jgi:hypothetical protein
MCAALRRHWPEDPIEQAAHRAVRDGACGGTMAPAVVAPDEPTLGFARGALLRDPDALQVVEP